MVILFENCDFNDNFKRHREMFCSINLKSSLVFVCLKYSVVLKIIPIEFDGLSRDVKLHVNIRISKYHDQICFEDYIVQTTQTHLIEQILFEVSMWVFWLVWCSGVGFTFFSLNVGIEFKL